MNGPTPNARAGHGGGVLHLPPAARRTIEEAAARGYPHEVCGVLLGSPVAGGVQVVEAVQVRNANAERARDRYQLDPDEFLRVDQRARAAGCDVVGIWHSHPDHPALPSATDRQHAWEEYAYVIVAVQRGSIDALRAWWLTHGEFQEAEVTDEEPPPRQREARS